MRLPDAIDSILNYQCFGILKIRNDELEIINLTTAVLLAEWVF
ncbi:MAG: hypothetical protein AVDCRST_MAG95-260 [uncultured Adhaeribacter sp.]|uniref:Uncharacterized protein n=1 Tax=uncultured Adhaeribacter sp. TaxID=448109 RepID=A0A6J4H8L9_9BACT|nr:MAG: hypothetical protein AVDCRST_MAG95-260 [uncultured Adhaeribacter sp.]